MKESVSGVVIKWQYKKLLFGVGNSLKKTNQF